MRPAIGGDRLEDSISTAMDNCSDNDGTGGEAAQLVRDDGEQWAKEDTSSAAIVIVISRN